jgi:hypothetical protein
MSGPEKSIRGTSIHENIRNLNGFMVNGLDLGKNCYASRNDPSVILPLMIT